MHTNKAFTLIEVMVVLSILAIIAILAYNFFGNTMKEATVSQAATKIYNELRTISDAAELYAIDNGDLPAGGHSAVVGLLVGGGYLKAWPTATNLVALGSQRYEYVNGYDDMDGGSVMDDIIYVSNYSDDVCAEFIAKYASALGTLQSAQWDWEAAGNTYPANTLGKGARVFAAKWATADVDKCEIEWVLRYND